MNSSVDGVESSNDALAQSATDPHNNKTVPYYLQDPAWAKFRVKHNWDSKILDIDGNQVIFYKRHVPGMGYFYYAPRTVQIFNDDVEHNKAIRERLETEFSDGFLITIEPATRKFDEKLTNSMKDAGFNEVEDNIQHQSTIKVDLDKSQDELLASFSQTARRNIRKAKRAGIKIKKVDIDESSMKTLFSLLETTSVRSKFYIRDRDFTMDYWRAFAEVGRGSIFIAYKGLDILAGAFVIHDSENSWYKDGGSVTHNSKLGGTTLLLWEVMKDLQKQGVKSYDLCGVAT